ncbi:MAG: hypothetical protein K8I03_10025, partial [Ignavibacteria bacterium]|nr:hypothetical protein [Ignavibacteria bacterium]
ITLLNDSSFLTFIIHRNAIRSNDYKKLRHFILNNCKINTILSFKIGVFEDVTGEVIIIILEKSSNTDNNLIRTSFLADNLENQEIRYTSISQDIFKLLADFRFNIYLNEYIINILKKLNKHRPLKEFADITQGIIVGDERKYILNFRKNDKYIPILRGKNISRYRIDFNSEYLFYVPGTKVLKRGKTKELFEVKEKILTQHVSSKIVAALDTNKFYYLQTINGIIMKEGFPNIRYFLALFNSKLINYYYEHTFNLGAEFTTAVAIENLENIPISIPNNKSLISKLILLTIEIEKSGTKNMMFIDRIDSIVYRIYDLSYDEVKIVDPEIEKKVSRKEYEQFEI